MDILAIRKKKAAALAAEAARTGAHDDDDAPSSTSAAATTSKSNETSRTGESAKRAKRTRQLPATADASLEGAPKVKPTAAKAGPPKRGPGGDVDDDTTAPPHTGAPTDAAPVAVASADVPSHASSASAHTTPTQQSSTPKAAPQRSPEATRPEPRQSREAHDEDILRGFLARYDEEGDEPDRYNAGVNTAADLSERYLSLTLRGERYAASIMDIREILTIRSLTEVPRAPREVLGVISKRGLVLPVVDLATALGLRAPDRHLRAAQRVLVVGEGERICGLRVDAVTEVIKLSQADVEPVPPSLGTRNAGLLLGLGRIGDAMYILLDLPAVLDAFAISVGLAPARTELRV